MALIQEFFDLKLHSPNPVSFIPVYLSSTDRATSQPHSGGSFQFSPTTSAVAFPKPRDIANRSADSDRLDILDLSDNLEVHSFPYGIKSTIRLTPWVRGAVRRFLLNPRVGSFTALGLWQERYVLAWTNRPVADEPVAVGHFHLR